MAAPSVIRMPAIASVTPAESRGDFSAKVADTSLDDLLYATAHKDRNCKALAAACQIGLSRFYDATNPNERKPFCVRWLVPLMKAAGDFSVLQWMARACGFVLIEAPGLTQPADVMASVGDIARETGDVLKTLSDVLRDGVVCKADARTARKEIADLLEHAHALDQALARIEGAR